MNEIWQSIGFSEDCDLLTLVRKKVVEQLHLKDSSADKFYRIERDPKSKRLMYHLMCSNELGYWMSDRAANLARMLIRKEVSEFTDGREIWFDDDEFEVINESR